MSGPQLCSKCKQPVALTAKFCAECGQAVTPTLVFGDYEALEVIGRGGMGQVYKAVQRRLNRVVCVKTLLPQFASDPETTARFAREATTTAALNHPNIVSIFDVGTTPAGVAYLVMEMIDGRPLRLILRDESPVPAPRAGLLMDQVLAALAEAHTHGIIHRDLKPGNVLVVSQRDGSELCKLLDFGIAHVATPMDEKLTRTGMMVGSPGYMAPEQIVGDEVDPRADLYAAGAILYELLCGERVVSAANDMERFKKVLMEDPAPPSSRTKAQVSAALDAVCLKALSRKAEHRYASASEFRDALSKALRGQASGSIAPGGGVSALPGPAVGAGGFAAGQIDYTPLASAVAPGSTSSDTNSRALVAAVLVSTDEWERNRLLEPFERSLREAITLGDFKSVRTTVTALQEELKLKGSTQNLKLLLDVTREVIEEQVPVLLGWLTDPGLRAGGRWLLQLLGKRALGTFIAHLPEQPAEAQQQLLEVMRSLDPDASLMAAQVKTMEPKALKALLVSARAWPAEQCFAVFNVALQATDALARQGALEAMDEATAFRFGLVIRQRLHDPSQGVRSQAMKWVARLEDEAAVPELARLAQRSALPPNERRAVWRTMGELKVDAAVEALALTLTTANELDDVAELARALVRSQAPHALDVVRAEASSSKTNPKRKATLEAALREGSGVSR